MEEKKNRKIYYSMGEVSEMFDVNPSLIRFWEQKFDILRPHKNKKGNRMFTPQDVENLKLIYHLVKEKGMTLAGAQKRIKENREGADRDLEVVDRLLAIRSMLMEVSQQLKVGGSFDDEDESSVPAMATLPEEPAEAPAAAEETQDEELEMAIEMEFDRTAEGPWEGADAFDAGASTGRGLFAQEEFVAEGVRTLLSGEDAEREYVAELSLELAAEDSRTEAEVMETIAELEQEPEKRPSDHGVIEQTLF